MIIGIDPGVRGGLALLTDTGGVVETIPLNGLKEKEVECALRAWDSLLWTTGHPETRITPHVFIEKVGYMGRKKGREKGDGGKGSFTFGAVFGLLRGLVLARGWEPRYIPPMVWQSALGCMTGGNKNVTKSAAISLFPDYAAGRKYGITHDIADALLIAEYGRRLLVREGRLG